MEYYDNAFIMYFNFSVIFSLLPYLASGMNDKWQCQRTEVKKCCFLRLPCQRILTLYANFASDSSTVVRILVIVVPHGQI